jgi:hypothetical protein
MVVSLPGLLLRNIVARKGTQLLCTRHGCATTLGESYQLHLVVVSIQLGEIG